MSSLLHSWNALQAGLVAAAVLAGPVGRGQDAAPDRTEPLPEGPSWPLSIEETPEGGYEVLLAVRGLPDEGGFGTAFGRAGDTNGDGVEDFFVTAPYRAAGRARRGSVRMFSGDDGRTLWRVDGEAFLERGPHQEGELGILATACADVDGDGVEDLVVGSVHRADDDRRNLALQVLSGATGRHVHGVVVDGPPEGASLGRFGDADGDGLSDVWVGVPGYGSDEVSGCVVILSPFKGVVLSQHPGTGNGFPAAGWSDGEGRLWVSAPAAPAGERLWRLNQEGLTAVRLHLFRREFDGHWGEALTGGPGLRCIGVLHVDETAPSLLATHREAGRYQIDSYMPDGGLVATAGVLDARTPPALVATPHFLETDSNGLRQFAVAWLDASRKGHAVVHECLSPRRSRVDRHACGHSFSVRPSLAPIDPEGDGRTELLVGGAGHFHGHPLSTQGEVQLVRYAQGAVLAVDVEAHDASVLRERGVLHLLEPPRLAPGVSRRVGFGGGLLAAGDLDGDGVADLAVGPWVAGENSEQLLAYSGRTGERLFAIVDDKLFGYAALGDRDGDGRGDLVVQSTDVPQRPGGRAWLGSGASGGPLGEERTEFAGWGQHVVRVGDVDGDGTRDLLIGAPVDSDGDGTVGPASARLHAGSDGRELRRFDLADKRDEFGAALAAAGDLDGDGKGDLLIGAPAARFDGEDRDRRGGVFAYSGASGALLFAAFGTAHGDRFGHALCGTPDADGDGVPDVLVGAPRAGEGRPGAAYLLSGADGTRLFELAGDRPDELFGQSVACGEDLGGDGSPELLVGAPVAAHVFPTQFGRVYAYAPADGREVFRLNDPVRRDEAIRGDFGWSLALPGDLDGDGRGEIAVGAPYRRLDRDDGSVWIFSGAALGR